MTELKEKKSIMIDRNNFKTTQSTKQNIKQLQRHTTRIYCHIFAILKGKETCTLDYCCYENKKRRRKS